MNPTNEALLPTVSPVGLGNRVAKNAAWLLAGRLGSQGLAMLFSILIARRLGEVGLGQYAFITSVIFLGNLTTTFGTDMLIIREVAAKRDLTLLPASLIVQLGLSIPFFILVWLLASLIPNQAPEAVLALKVYSLVLIPLAFYSVFSSALRGVERMDSFTWLNMLYGALLLVFGLALLRADTSVLTLAFILLSAQTLAAIIAGVLCALQIPGIYKAWHTTRPKLIRLIKLSAPIAILGLLGALYQRLAIFILATQQGAAATGTFSAALRLLEAAKIGNIALLSALFPAMAQANSVTFPSSNRNSAVAFQKIFTSSLGVLVVVAAALAVSIFFFADALIPLLFGSDFQSSIPVLRTLAWMLIPVTISYYLSLMLLAAARERAIMLALGASTLLLAVFIVVALPQYGLQGAAVGMLAAEVLQSAILIFSWLRVRRQRAVS